jgi:hypothetical protein
MTTQNNKYVNLTANGQLFPLWIMKNFKKYKLPEIFRQDDVDPCSVKHKLELRKYQMFISEYLDYNSPFKNILVYHGLGAGKTATSINIYNMLYNYTPGWNIFILIKASLKDDPWLKDIKTWLGENEYNERFNNIIFIHYDSPFADRDFMDAIRKADSTKKSMYIIDECHNFIRNVYSNMNSKHSRRILTIYEYIINEQKENTDTRVICISATPGINEPFEFGLLFNLLRPGIFPKNEVDFNHLYISDLANKTLSNNNKNMFQRRIMGLVSYYLGATSDLFATKKIINIELEMTQYHSLVYQFFEDYEMKILSLGFFNEFKKVFVTFIN